MEIIAKIKNEYRNVLSTDNEIFRINELQSQLYSSDYKLEENEWYHLEDFSNLPYMINECQDDYSTASLVQINNNDYSKINVVCVIGQDKIYFQHITPSLYIDRKRFLDFNDDPKIVTYTNQIHIKKEPDAIYDKSVNKLYFKDLSKIKNIFPNIENLYREATNDEVETFLNLGFINIENRNIGVTNRKRITSILEKFQNLSQEKQNQLISYAQEKSGIELDENENFKINSETDLKNLIFALHQRYYYSDIYDENRIANSIIVI